MKMSTDANANIDNVDVEYPGTAVLRLNNVRARVATLSEQDLSGEWEDVRRKILWAGGLRDLPRAIPGEGYTGHAFNDYNHVDLTTMNDDISDNENGGEVRTYVKRLFPWRSVSVHDDTCTHSSIYAI